MPSLLHVTQGLTKSLLNGRLSLSQMNYCCPAGGHQKGDDRRVAFRLVIQCLIQTPADGAEQRQTGKRLDRSYLR